MSGPRNSIKPELLFEFDPTQDATDRYHILWGWKRANGKLRVDKNPGAHLGIHTISAINSGQEEWNSGKVIVKINKEGLAIPFQKTHLVAVPANGQGTGEEGVGCEINDQVFDESEVGSLEVVVAMMAMAMYDESELGSWLISRGLFDESELGSLVVEGHDGCLTNRS